MEIRLHRKYKKKDYTVGRMYVDGIFFCNTLEDAVRDIQNDGKIPGKTAIPAGTYKVDYTLSPRFGRRLPLLVGVPYFSGIRIHPGNMAADTEGCILVGLNTAVGRLTSSRWYSDLLNERIERAIARSENITIEIYE